MTIRNTYASESWDKVYTAFKQINFTAYDYDTVKESLIQYLQIYHPEDFNDFIESSEMVMILEMFAYAAELMAYRTDAVAHENFISTAQRKQSILKLAKLISYSAARNIPARGLVKIDSIKTDEAIFDSLGNNLSNRVIVWNDPNNSNWKEQFFLVMNAVMTTKFGQPSKSAQIGDVLMQQYTFNNAQNAFRNGVFAFSANASSGSVPMEVVPLDLDSNGPFERAPDLFSQFNIAYASDGRGDGSDYTGFLMFVKQGGLVLTNYQITEPVPNRRLTLNQANVNDTDVWIYQVDDNGVITQKWQNVPSLMDQTLSYNDIDSRFKYEIETLENDQIAIIFGDGNFAEIPMGRFQLWTRVSVNDDVVIPRNRIVGQGMTFAYSDQRNIRHTCSITFSLTASLQNNAPSETIEHIRQSAPATYYSQNRMVNGQDHNTFMLRDSTILKLNSINRTFAGQPKYIEWNDASGAYQNIKLFGDDLVLRSELGINSVTTTSSSRTLIDTFIEPVLSSNAILNILTHQMANAFDSSESPVGYGIISKPRRKFIEDNRKKYFTLENDELGNPIPVYPYGVGREPSDGFNGELLEKTAIQAALDGRWYGEPLSTVTIGGTIHGVIPDPILNPESTGKLYVDNLPRTIDGVNTYPPGDIGSGFNSVSREGKFGIKYNRFLKAIGNGTIAFAQPLAGQPLKTDYEVSGIEAASHKVETLTIEMQSDGTTFSVVSNIRGSLPSYSLTVAANTPNGLWSEQAGSIPVDFVITPGLDAFEQGDAFVIDIDISYRNPDINVNTWGAQIRQFGISQQTSVNLNGWWEVIPGNVLRAETGIFEGDNLDGPNEIQQKVFDQTGAASWIFLVSSQLDSDTGEVLSWTIFNRDMKLIASSPTTKFWYNQDSQIIDSETLKPLYDKIRILRSNLDEFGTPLKKAEIYDCVGLVYDESANVIPNSLEILPTDTLNRVESGDGAPDNLLQFEMFARGAYAYTLLEFSSAEAAIRFDRDYTSTELPCGTYKSTNGYDIYPYDWTTYDSPYVAIKIVDIDSPINGAGFEFIGGSFISQPSIAFPNYRLMRTYNVPSKSVAPESSNDEADPCNVTTGLDFMWQHYTPNSNLIDPSVSNIHDTYIMPQGYYNSVMDYVRGRSNIMPQPPTPLELRTSYGYLLDNKMLSDTIVLHPGKIKLLFGQLADQKLRAKFRVIMAPTATMSSERVKQEIINVVNKYFDIENWDFGATFYATELISLIHQALPTQISSVVLVPTYSVNSFGSLFTIESGLDEILQSCATVNDVEIVSALTPALLRQS